jgi:hypothetical protein
MLLHVLLWSYVAQRVVYGDDDYTRHIARLHAVWISHHHADHCLGLLSLARTYAPFLLCVDVSGFSGVCRGSVGRHAPRDMPNDRAELAPRGLFVHLLVGCLSSAGSGISGHQCM